MILYFRQIRTGIVGTVFKYMPSNFFFIINFSFTWLSGDIYFLLIHRNLFIQCIRCHTDDGPSSEEVKKIVRTCMNKLEDHNKHGSSTKNRFKGEIDNDDDYDSSDSDDDDDDDNGGNNNQRNWQKDQGIDQNRYPNNRPTRFRRNVTRPAQMQQPSDNMDMQRKHTMDTNRSNNRSNNNNGNESSNSSACLTQCFFQEMKMVRFVSKRFRQTQI